MLPMDSPHDFYRMAGDGFVPGMGIGVIDAGGRRVSLRKFTYMYCAGANVTRGAPALEEAAASDRVAFRFFDPPGPEVDEITRRVRCHLPPMRRVDASPTSDDFADVAANIDKVFMRELGDAAYKRVDFVSAYDVQDADASGTVVVLHRFARTFALTAQRVRSVATLVRMNQSIAEVSVETVVLGPGRVADGLCVQGRRAPGHGKQRLPRMSRLKDYIHIPYARPADHPARPWTTSILHTTRRRADSPASSLICTPPRRAARRPDTPCCRPA
jgi:hypothetical protein